jgi:hypothetical protein
MSLWTLLDYCGCGVDSMVTRAGSLKMQKFKFLRLFIYLFITMVVVMMLITGYDVLVETGQLSLVIAMLAVAIIAGLLDFAITQRKGDKETE